jgi:hypothetical protein
MKMKSFAATAGVAALTFALCIAPGALQAQPLYDRIHVNLPYTVTLGEKTLQPGDYTIQQLPDNGGGGRILLFYTENGMKFETSAMTIPALDTNTARDTKLVLNHVGNDYYIDKIWVQGKDYGYELPVPKGLKSREKEATTTTVAAQSQPAPAPAATEQTPATPPPPVTSQTEARRAEESTAQNNQATRPVEPPQTTPTPAPTPDPNASTADRAMAEQEPPTPTPAPTRMPNTSANWLVMLLSGGTVYGAGLLLRRKS